MHSQGKNNRFNTLFKGHQTFLSCDGLHADKNIEEITENNAVYQLQLIEFTGKQISIFCDNGCDDFVSTYDTVKRICTKCNPIVKMTLKVTLKIALEYFVLVKYLSNYHIRMAQI